MSRWVADGEEAVQFVIEVTPDGELTLDTVPTGRSWTTKNVGQARAFVDQLIAATRLMEDRRVRHDQS